jgi:hypothetical protein
MTLAAKSASALAVYGQSREIKLFFTRINIKQELQGGWKVTKEIRIYQQKALKCFFNKAISCELVF